MAARHSPLPQLQEGASEHSSGRRRLAAVLAVVGLVAIICIKAGAARGGIQVGYGAFAPQIELLSGSGGSQSIEQRAENGMKEGKAGWDKSNWTSSDWAAWTIPGPIFTCIAVVMIFQMYGALWAAGLLAVLVTVDVCSFYTNV